MSMRFPTAPLASGLMRAGGGAVENPQPVQRFHYLSEIPVQLIPTSALSSSPDDHSEVMRTCL